MTDSHDAVPAAATAVDEAIGGAGEAIGGAGEARPAPGTHRKPPVVLRGMGHIKEHDSDRWWRSWLVRTSALLLGTLALATAFIASYVGGLHNPSPHDVPVAVVRGDVAAGTLMAQVRARTTALKAVEYADPAAAVEALRHRNVYAVLATSQVAQSPGLTLATASGASPAATQVIEDTLAVATSATGSSLAVADVVPTSHEDPRGLVPFYLVVGLVLAGYLGSTALGISLGTVPRNLDRAAMRIAALGVFSVLTGVAGAIVVGPILDIWTEHRIGLAIAGSLIVFASAMFAAAVQGWLGLLGTGLVILVLVVLGNPGSGGIYPPEFLPGFNAFMHRWNLPGLGVSLVKGVAYFDRKATGWPITALALWALVGVAGLIGATAALGRRAQR